jgi:hypothetical protein
MAAAKKRTLEKDFQKRVVEMATALGWKHMHIGESTKRVRRGSSFILVPDPDCQGWPDLTLCHPRTGKMLFRELKTDTGKLTDPQRDWLRTLAKCGQDVDVSRPRDWDEIVALLNV